MPEVPGPGPGPGPGENSQEPISSPEQFDEQGKKLEILTLPITVDYDKPIDKVIEESGVKNFLNHLNDKGKDTFGNEIAPAYKSSKAKKGIVPCNVKLVDLGSLPTNEALQKLRKLGLDPIDLRELATVAPHLPRDERYIVPALGSEPPPKDSSGGKVLLASLIGVDVRSQVKDANNFPNTWAYLEINRPRPSRDFSIQTVMTTKSNDDYEWYDPNLKVYFAGIEQNK